MGSKIPPLKGLLAGRLRGFFYWLKTRLSYDRKFAIQDGTQKMVDLDTLNPEQRLGVTHFEGPTMILAGAGTGKTRVITCRIAYMLDAGVAPETIAAMTFTNKAAREMKERIRPMVGSARAKKLSISTFHSFCLNIMRTWPQKMGLEKGFTLVGTGDQLDLVRRALDEKGWSGLYKPDEILAQIGACKNWLLSPDAVKRGELPRGASIEDPALLGVCYELYERQLKLNRAIDFDDCILKVIFALKEHEDFRLKLLEKYQYLLVDEFQDTNFAQFELLEALSHPRNNVCVVGDDDQSIYSWRGAMYETLEKFQSVFPGTKMIKLEQNYRCTNVILNAANSVIKNNSRRMDKTLWSASTGSLPIDVVPHEDAVDEARWTAQKIITLMGQGKKPADIAILYRANAQADLMEKALREASIPYKTFGGQSFFERQEVKDFMGYLRLMASAEDHLALWRVINTPPRGIGLKTQEWIESHAKAGNTSPYKIMKDLPGTESERQSQAISEFVSTLETLRQLPVNTPDDLEALGDAINSSFRLVDYIKDSSKNIQVRVKKLENLRSLPKWLKKAGEDMIADEGVINGHRLLDRLTLQDSTYEKEDSEGHQSNYVSLMTIHASKGLEFPVVFLCGLEDGLLPHKNSILNFESIAEERRLFYVAMTRAKEKLLMTYAHLRQTGFQKEIRTPSRFLTELPENGVISASLVQILEDKTKGEADRKTKTLSRLSAIKES